MMQADAPVKATIVDPTYAWTMALLPAATIPVAFFAPTLNTTGALAIGALALSLLLARLDTKRLQAGGVVTDSLFAHALFGSPGWYLIRRTRVASSTPALPVVWFAGLAGLLLAVFTFAAAYSHDRSDVEAEMRSWLIENGAINSVTVVCPHNFTGKPGDVMDCVATAQGETATIRATMTDDGGYEWQTLGY